MSIIKWSWSKNNFSYHFIIINNSGGNNITAGIITKYSVILKNNYKNQWSLMIKTIILIYLNDIAYKIWLNNNSNNTMEIIVIKLWILALW